VAFSKLKMARHAPAHQSQSGAVVIDGFAILAESFEDRAFVSELMPRPVSLAET